MIGIRMVAFGGTLWNGWKKHICSEGIQNRRNTNNNIRDRTKMGIITKEKYHHDIILAMGIGIFIGLQLSILLIHIFA